MKEKSFYEQIKDWNFQKFHIETEKFTKWDMYEILRNITNKDACILDIGTGGGEKLIANFPEVKEILGTDFSEEMIKTAKKNLELSKRKNITFRIMDNLAMDTPEEYYDVVVARNTVIDAKQIYRTLKRDGYLLVRGVDKYDCYELKLIFGRGQAMHDIKPISILDYEQILEAGFRDVELIPIHVREYFKTKADLVNFLKKVPILDDFNEQDGDNKIYYSKSLEEDKLNQYIKRNTYPKGIRLIRRYYGIVAKK